MNLQELNKEQRLAAQTLEGPLLVLAGAGSGKTRALTYRVANLIDHGVPAWSIMAITFTNKAAAEMRERIETLVGPRARYIRMGTFHSVFARILRENAERIGFPQSFTIYEPSDVKNLLKTIVKELNLTDVFVFQPDPVLIPQDIHHRQQPQRRRHMGLQVGIHGSSDHLRLYQLHIHSYPSASNLHVSLSQFDIYIISPHLSFVNIFYLFYSFSCEVRRIMIEYTGERKGRPHGKRIFL